jgi:hypothetical protein
LDFEIDVPRSNPPIKKRHAIVNAYFNNMDNEKRCFIYDKWINKGFVQTKFLKDSLTLEDDNLPQQHVTTAIGYAIYRQSIVGDNESSTIMI